jgi:hypothetical protein
LELIFVVFRALLSLSLFLPLLAHTFTEKRYKYASEIYLHSRRRRSWTTRRACDVSRTGGRRTTNNNTRVGMGWCFCCLWDGAPSTPPTVAVAVILLLLADSAPPSRFFIRRGVGASTRQQPRWRLVSPVTSRKLGIQTIAVVGSDD